ncbi:hypothetical protein B0T12DRAFT_400322 [Alternaria alternata]|nr:hypothetical protein B0T12DRAFT_400322 [Alternaria alternata]
MIDMGKKAGDAKDVVANVERGTGAGNVGDAKVLEVKRSYSWIPAATIGLASRKWYSVALVYRSLAIPKVQKEHALMLDLLWKKAKRHSFRYIGCFALTIAVFEQHSHRHGAKTRGPQREYQICLEVCLEVRLSQMVDTVTKVNETDIDALHRSGASRNLGSPRSYVLLTTSSNGSRDKQPASAIFE